MEGEVNFQLDKEVKVYGADGQRKGNLHEVEELLQDGCP